VRIQARYVFYLDFQLPEFRDTDVAKLVIGYGNQTAIIEPWDHAGDLFEGELGQTLKTAQFLIAAVSPPGGQLARRVADAVIDRLVVAIEWDHDGDPVGDESLIQVRLEEAVAYANFFITHLRAVTGSAHLNRIEVYWNPDDLTFSVQIPYSAQWFNLDTNVALQMFQGPNGLNSAGGIRLPYNGAVKWDAVVAGMSTGTLPPFHRTLLVDARDALTTADIREAILSIASSCDVRANDYMKVQTRIAKSRAEQIIKQPGASFARRYFDLLPLATCGQSLSTYDARIFADVQSCYRQRNNLIHAGDLLDPLVDMGIADRLCTVSQWRLSAESALAWVDSLPTAP
jgi:hypothetical protein